MCIGVLTLHTMKSGKEWHQVRSNNHFLSWRYNEGGCTQCERKKLKSHSVHCGHILLEGVANLLKFPDMCIGVLTLHTMKSGKEWHQIRFNNHFLSLRYNVGGWTQSWRVYVVPHGPKCIEVPLHSLLTLMLFMWGFHWIKIQDHSRICFL